jgi:hypothetical protein
MSSCFLSSVAVVFETLAGIKEISMLLTHALGLPFFRLFSYPCGWIRVPVKERAADGLGIAATHPHWEWREYGKGVVESKEERIEKKEEGSGIFVEKGVGSRLYPFRKHRLLGEGRIL